MFKPGSNPRSESEDPKTGDESSQTSDLAGRVIFRIPDDFDINEVFRSEGELSPEKSGARSADAPPPAWLAPILRDEHSPNAASTQSTEQAGTLRPTLSLADLIENNVRLDWQEAVAIALALCHAASGDPATNVQHSLVEPWNVELTGVGDVRLLPGGPGSNPTVKEVGRILSALLQGSIAPVDLRLLASQASFDVPLFGSIGELAEALKRFERPGEQDAIRKTFLRGVEAKFSTPAVGARDTSIAPPPASTHDPMLVRKEAAPAAPKAAPRQPDQETHKSHWMRVSAIAASLLLLLGLGVWALLPVMTPAPPPVEQLAVAPAPLAIDVDLPTDPALVVPQGPEEFVRPVAPRVERRVEAVQPAPVVAPRAAPPRARAAPPPPVARPPVRPADPADLTSQRASELLASGQSQDAALAIDALVMAQPFYQPPPGSSPDVLAAIRASKRNLLPTLARNRYESARIAFDGGDIDRALADGRIAALMLKEGDSAPAPDLSAALDRFLVLVSDAKAVEEQRIYTVNDPGVTPPVAIGNQLPAGGPPPGVRPPQVGQLEMLIGRSGQVESVKLHTPANRYAERMIVSAAKAWKFRPALRNGKPVRFNLTMSINLPES